MKCSLEILKDYSEIPVKNLISRKKTGELSFPRPVFTAGRKVLLPDTLYISYSEDAASFESVSPDAGLILIGELPEGEALHSGGILIFDRDADILEVFNEMTRIYDLFDAWESALLKAASLGRATEVRQKMLEASSPVFGNGIAVMSFDFRIVFQNEANRKYGGFLQNDSRSDFPIAPEILDYFKYDRDYRNIMEERDVFYYEGDVLPHRVLCKNIFLEDRFLFRIILNECVRPFRDTDRVLLELLSEHILRCIGTFTFRKGFSESALSGIIIEGLETGKVSRMAADAELKRLLWEQGDTYLILSIHPGADDLLLASQDFHASEIMNRFPETYAFPYKDAVIAVVNKSRAGTMDPYFERFRLFVRENNFRVGISNESDDFNSLRTMYGQAEMAHAIGEEEKPTEWIHWFSAYTMSYIYKLLRDTGLGELYSPLFYQLQKYDAQSGTSYLETLRVYLDCGSNTVRAAKELYVQRSTMIYRLKRIREITKKDLTDRDELLHLRLTFAIIDHGKRTVV